MRNYTMTLAECMDNYQDTLFTFDYEFPEPYKPIFERLFLLRFGYRNIGFESYPLFKQMLEAELGQLMPKYIDLYASVKIKYNPFINYETESESFKRDKARRKNIATANHKGVNYGDSSGINSASGGQGSVGGSNENNLTTDLGNSKRKSIGDRRNDKLDLYTDSPQNQHEGEETGSNGIDPPRESEKYFNDGYLTTKRYNPETETKIDSDNVDTYGRHAGESSSETFNNVKTYDNAINQNKSINRSQAYNDSEQIDSNQFTSKVAQTDTGLRGVLKSDVIRAWRKSFISVDQMLLDELDSLFLGIY